VRRVSDASEQVRTNRRTTPRNEGEQTCELLLRSADGTLLRFDSQVFSDLLNVARGHSETIRKVHRVGVVESHPGSIRKEPPQRLSELESWPERRRRHERGIAV
jgi:hypothetical protein